jgi:hypothetical protein
MIPPQRFSTTEYYYEQQADAFRLELSVDLASGGFIMDTLIYCGFISFCNFVRYLPH